MHWLFKPAQLKFNLGMKIYSIIIILYGLSLGAMIISTAIDLYVFNLFLIILVQIVGTISFLVYIILCLRLMRKQQKKQPMRPKA